MEVILQIFVWLAGIAPILLIFLFLFVCGLFINVKKPYERDSGFYRALLDRSTAVILWIIGVRYNVVGAERLPERGNFLFISNHRSNYDPIIQWTVFSRFRISFISKKENFKIPMYGRLIHRCCFMAIDRENPRKAMETINRAAKLLTDTENSVGVYPEGRRSKDCTLLPFHNGVLKIAKKAGRPIVVSTIEGTENIFGNVKRLRRTVVTIRILETIDAQRVRATSTADLGEYCAEHMKKEIGG